MAPNLNSAIPKQPLPKNKAKVMVKRKKVLPIPTNANANTNTNINIIEAIPEPILETIPEPMPEPEPIQIQISIPETIPNQLPIQIPILTTAIVPATNTDTTHSVTIKSENHAQTFYYNDYMAVLDKSYCNVTGVKITSMDMPKLKFNIDDECNELKFIINNSTTKYNVQNGLYNAANLIQTIRDGIMLLCPELDIYIDEKRHVVIKNDSVKEFELIPNTNDILPKLGFTRSSYKKRNMYVSEKKCHITDSAIIYLYMPDLFFKENIAKINLQTGVYEQCATNLEHAITELNALIIKFKTNEDFVKETLYDFNGSPHILKMEFITAS
jgi:hypothetical protein